MGRSCAPGRRQSHRQSGSMDVTRRDVCHRGQLRVFRSRLRATDATAGSVNAVIWFDNAQLWNQTQLPNQVAAGMPWCDLRAVNSPAQLVVSGLLGDLPSPAALALGTYVSSLPAGGALTVYVGRKAITNPNAQYVGFSFAAFSPLWTPQGFAQLDPGSYGGFTGFVTVNPGWNPRFTSMLTKDAVGVYHILARVKTAQTTPNLPNITLRAVTEQQTDAWYGLLSGTDLVGAWQGPYVAPFTQSTVWTLADARQAILPPVPSGALSDPSQLNLIPRAQWSDTTAAGRRATRTGKRCCRWMAVSWSPPSIIRAIALAR